MNYMNYMKHFAGWRGVLKNFSKMRSARVHFMFILLHVVHKLSYAKCFCRFLAVSCGFAFDFMN